MEMIPGYFASPEKADRPLPGVVVIGDVFGVSPYIEDLTRRIAAAGYASYRAGFLLSLMGKNRRDRCVTSSGNPPGQILNIWADSEHVGLEPQHPAGASHPLPDWRINQCCFHI